MAAVVIRNIPEATHRALKARAKAHGRSTEAEIREILEKALVPSAKMGLGDKLAEISKAFGGIELDIPSRSKVPVEPPSFE